MVEVLAEVKTTLDPMASRAGVELVVAPIPATAQQGVADLTRFKQILMNLGSNAIKYGRRGGTTTFRIDAHGDAMRVTVIDDGIGIPEDKQHKIFQPFQRAGQETGPIEGTGIGLAITRRLADLMHGKVGFRSSEGQGSEFWIEIPIYQPEVTADLNLADIITPENSLRTARGRTHLVVYIEDNPSNLAFMEDLISDFVSLELVTAPTAEIGIEIVRARRPDVVIMDINLPGMSGFEAARRLSQWVETQDIPIIALSAAAMVRDKAQISEAGFFRYLTKPVKVDELAQVLEELIVPNSR
jgi:CheY-like chemotaxis protein